MFRFSGLLVAVALVLVAQEAQAQDTSQHIAGGGRAQSFSGELWSMSVAADVETDGSASGHLRLRSGSDGVYDIAITGGTHLGDHVSLDGTGADGKRYDIQITDASIAIIGPFSQVVDVFVLQRGHIGF